LVQYSRANATEDEDDQRAIRRFDQQSKEKDGQGLETEGEGPVGAEEEGKEEGGWR